MNASKTAARLTIEGLALDIHLGWPGAERQKIQRILVDITINYISPPTACTTDNLAETVCYSTLIDYLQTQLINKTFRLIESLAQAIYDLLKTYVGLPAQIKVSVYKKPNIKSLTGRVAFHVWGD